MQTLGQMQETEYDDAKLSNPSVPLNFPGFFMNKFSATDNNVPVRVLHILHSMDRGGAENAIMNYYRNIDRRRIQFDFLLTAPLKCQFEDEILSLGGRIYRVPNISKFSPFPYLFGVRRFFKEHPQYRIVHSHTSSKSAIPLFIAKRCGIPVRICHSHGSRSECGINGWIREILKIPLRFIATDFFACGEKAADYLYGKNTRTRERAVIFPNVIETSRFRFDSSKRTEMRKRLGIGDKCFVIGHVSRFSWLKNHRFGLDVFKELRTRHPNSKLLLVGDGELRSDIERQAREIGISGDVIMTGIVPDVGDYVQAMDAFLFPSLHEGTPLALIEAQISGLNCYTTKGGVPEDGDITGLVHYISLEKGARYWAEEILKRRNEARTDRLEDVVRNGYDAATSAVKLQNFYTERYLGLRSCESTCGEEFSAR